MPMNEADLADMATAWGLTGEVLALYWIGGRRWLCALGS